MSSKKSLQKKKKIIAMMLVGSFGFVHAFGPMVSRLE